MNFEVEDGDNVRNEVEVLTQELKKESHKCQWFVAPEQPELSL